MAADMKRIVVRVGLQCDEDKIKAMKAVCSIEKVASVSADMEQKKLTVIGFFDPVIVVSKLRKCWHTKILVIGLANEPGRGRTKQRRERRRRKELLMNRSPSLRRHNKNTRGLILLISQLKLTDNSLDTV
ncbi:heavy metal-associated isoprenylated plant protein 39-like [Musa acuminata AAA Group]|uniref:heavy metal-associated isoprenylated plant protein 39-like n=1 Tax=Musa acuminata AAA Group TaxID=214697 RepID=UPI0031E0C0EB